MRLLTFLRPYKLETLLVMRCLDSLQQLPRLCVVWGGIFSELSTCELIVHLLTYGILNSPSEKMTAQIIWKISINLRSK